MNDPLTTSDASILAELGDRLSRKRLERNLTQAQLAAAAGVSKRTVERIESGESTQATNLIRVLRAFGLLENVDLLVPPARASPMEQLRAEREKRRRERRRASGKSAGAEDRTTASPEGDRAKRAWTWGGQSDSRTRDEDSP